MDELLPKVEKYVQDFMSRYDASHDYEHVERVRILADRIEAEEVRRRPNTRYDSDAITLAALLHDIGDSKYANLTEQGLPSEVGQVMLLSGAEKNLAEKVEIIVNHVSYTREISKPDETHQCLLQHPELGVVMDADRLDAIGAMGIARCFVYGGAKTRHSLGDMLAHFDQKLLKLEDMMKTETGKEMARVRVQRLMTFKHWWIEEAGEAGGTWHQRRT